MDFKHRRWLNGSSVVEMAYIMPLFLSLFVIMIHTIFYYHDKAILNGAAAETAVLGAQSVRRYDKNYEMETFFRERVQGKLIYMTDVEVKVQVEKEDVRVSAEAQRTFMKIDVCRTAKIVKPEKKIRYLK